MLDDQATAIDSIRFSDAAALVTTLKPSYPVYCFRPHKIRAVVQHFIETFPGKVVYAVKCNIEPRMLSWLSEAGVTAFDTASLTEIAAVRKQLPDADALFMHPVKSRASILAADQVYDVSTYCVDSMAELEKVLQVAKRRDLKIFVRVATPSSKATFELSVKFGATQAEAIEILDRVAKEGMQAGIAFHIGSQCINPRAFRTAFAVISDVWRGTKAEVREIDVGSGFPVAYAGQSVPPLEDFVKEIVEGRRETGIDENVALLCEPGRALVADGCSMLCQVYLRKGNRLYLNDGLYGNLSEPYWARIRLPVRLIRAKNEICRTNNTALQDFTIFGPTCDGNDFLPTPFRLPSDVREGDWIEVGQIGAYGAALATKFNGFFANVQVELSDEPPCTG
ncbi:pyridoxal-dependent decarboxylase, C-terminal sheet domain protein [Candidatus Endolissoclinum faulkneri L2]|uniref:ornithine decarboxylase n=1 Tax=Candidatus Endolissoclinum faulkneri L2 TaxID=1193729 RepID=K7Z5T7_9PROT|nr:alanine racemase [Candidatus Endolissoclinum faulkneri]AFX99428.1 pyridoxal-dependent decarboxylase, C-terminal sheet domain protein [Candidatus Endolissoclinum faulkneri L2]